MEVVVELPAVLAELAGSSRLPLPVAGPATLDDVIDHLARQYPAVARRMRDEAGALRRYVNVYVDGEDVRAVAGLASPVGPGSTVLVVPSVAGG